MLDEMYANEETASFALFRLVGYFDLLCQIIVPAIRKFDPRWTMDILQSGSSIYFIFT